MAIGQRVSFRDANRSPLTGKPVNGVVVAVDRFAVQVRRDDSGRVVTVPTQRIIAR